MPRFHRVIVEDCAARVVGRSDGVFRGTVVDEGPRRTITVQATVPIWPAPLLLLVTMVFLGMSVAAVVGNDRDELLRCVVGATIAGGIAMRLVWFWPRRMAIEVTPEWITNSYRLLGRRRRRSVPVEGIEALLLESKIIPRHMHSMAPMTVIGRRGDGQEITLVDACYGVDTAEEIVARVAEFLAGQGRAVAIAQGARPVLAGPL
jgi:hypothetical protein